MNSSSSDYKDYGGRGIKMCREWSESSQAFHDWALENGYKEGLSIDRIDVNGNYEPSNCRWANDFTQANNRTNNVVIEHNGKIQTVAEWARELCIPSPTIYSRLSLGLCADDVLKPPRESAKKQSGIKGISWHKQSGKWRIRHLGKSYGTFIELDDAIKALDEIKSKPIEEELTKIKKWDY